MSLDSWGGRFAHSHLVTLLYSNKYDVKINTLQTKEITLHLNEFGRWLSEKKPLGCYHFLDLAKDCGISSAFHNLALSHRFTVLSLSTQDWQPFNKHASYVNIYHINTYVQWITINHTLHLPPTPTMTPRRSHAIRSSPAILLVGTRTPDGTSSGAREPIWRPNSHVLPWQPQVGAQPTVTGSCRALFTCGRNLHRFAWRLLWAVH